MDTNTEIKSPLQEPELPINQFIYTNNNFPCLVAKGEAVEDPDSAPNLEEKYRRVARNALRHLTYGVSAYESKLLTWSNFKALFLKRDPALFHALRKELKSIFYNAFDLLNSKQLDEQAEARLIIFIKNLLAAYPYLDPEQNEVIYLPQKVNGEWHFAEFKFDKIDISPQSGLLSKLVEDEDRLYAYGLVPTSSVYPPYLILMGSHYPSGQGALLNWIYNFFPMKSVGEGHDTTNIVKWLQKHPGANITGHSKGGTMAMILATKYPQHIAEANCLNPAPLSPFTANRLKANLEKISDHHKPVINVYVQVKDPVFLLGKDFSYGSVIYSIGKSDQAYSYLEAHAHYFTGNKEATIKVLNENEIKSVSSLREFFSYLKEASNWAIFPALYGRLVYTLVARKVERFYSEHKTAFDVGFFAIGCAALLALSATVLAPVTVPIIATLGPIFGYGVIGAATGLISAAVTPIFPKITKFFSDSISTVSLLTSMLLGGIGSCIAGTAAYCAKIFARKFGHTENKPQERIVEELITEPFGTHRSLAKVFHNTKSNVIRDEESKKVQPISEKKKSPSMRIAEADFLEKMEPKLFPENSDHDSSPTVRKKI